MILLITYDLNKAGQNYDALYEQIKTAPAWIHLLDSTWLIRTSETPQKWSDKLMAVMDKNDRLFVVDITKQSHQGWLSKDRWDWITKNDI
jgi:hypothetical protein